MYSFTFYFKTKFVYSKKQYKRKEFSLAELQNKVKWGRNNVKQYEVKHSTKCWKIENLRDFYEQLYAQFVYNYC